MTPYCRPGRCTWLPSARGDAHHHQLRDGLSATTPRWRWPYPGCRSLICSGEKSCPEPAPRRLRRRGTSRTCGVPAKERAASCLQLFYDMKRAAGVQCTRPPAPPVPSFFTDCFEHFWMQAFTSVCRSVGALASPHQMLDHALEMYVISRNAWSTPGTSSTPFAKDHMSESFLLSWSREDGNAEAYAAPSCGFPRRD